MKAVLAAQEQNTEIAKTETPLGKKLWEFMKGLGKTFDRWWVKAVGYIVLLMVIYFLLYYTGEVYKTMPAKDREKVDKVERAALSRLGQIWYDIKKFFRSLFSFFHPGYKIKSFMAMFKSDPSGGFTETLVSREQATYGRCDNVNNIETTAEGQRGQCVVATEPAPLEFTMSTKDVPEWNKLPDFFKEKHKKLMPDDSLKLYMPFVTREQGSYDTFYIPQCEKTYYLNDKGEKVDMRLFSENYLTCGLLEKQSTLYNTPMYRDGTGYGYHNK
jgi:hypothetical protein